MTSNNNALQPRTGFNIGADFAFYGLTPNTTNDEVVAGFSSTTFMSHSRKRTTKFVRKWLTLRLHAFERGIHFSEDVTVAFLEKLLSRTDGFCPFTDVRLTSGTLTDNDWSIDRICNQFGYIPINIVVMTKALNEKKSNMTVHEISKIVDGGDLYLGFSADAWRRIYDNMILVESLFTNIGDISQEINTVLNKRKQTLLSLLSIIIAEEDEDFRAGILKVLLANVDGEKAINKMKKLVRTLIIKSGNTKETNLDIILSRSASLSRQITTLSATIDTTHLKQRANLHVSKATRYADEAYSTTKLVQ